jgi:hypothetical protein
MIRHTLQKQSRCYTNALSPKLQTRQNAKHTLEINKKKENPSHMPGPNLHALP